MLTAKKKMISAFHHVSIRMVRAALAICLGLILIFSQFASEVNAAKTFMTGDFAKDTISVSSTLKETITLPKEEQGLSEAEKEAVFLISDYISRYRNRSQVNTSTTFTTMQTALNALSGHYKTLMQFALLKRSWKYLLEIDFYILKCNRL